MQLKPLEAAVKRVLLFIKSGNSQPASRPGFAHALKLSYNLIAKERLTVTNNNKTLTYRFQLSKDIPTPSVGLFMALMDELSTCGLFIAGSPSPPGASLQMQTELLRKPQDIPNEFDVVNTVTKLGRTISHTRTEFVCPTTQEPLAYSSHVKYMPTGSRILDFVFTNKRAYALFEKWMIQRKPDPPACEEKNLVKEVIGSNLEYTNTQQGRFHITREHVNPFGNMHGGCHSMVMDQVGTAFAKAQLKSENVVLEAMQVDFVGAARGVVEFYCETIGQTEGVVHVRVLLKKGERVCSEGKLRFSATDKVPPSRL